VIERLLTAADDVVVRARHCWLMTLSSGRIDARPMGRVLSAPSQAHWTLGFLADSRSKKVRDIRSAAAVRLIFEHDEDAFVSLAGTAVVIADPDTLERRWLPAYDRNFPTAADKANAVFLDIRAAEIRLWIRGLTPEPFGLQSLTLRRPVEGDWEIQATEAGVGAA
jgi:general stress protein 26